MTTAYSNSGGLNPYALSFDGDDSVDCGSLIDPKNALTLEAFINTSTTSGTRTIVCKYNNPDSSVDGLAWILRLAGTNIEFYTNSGTFSSLTYPLTSTNEWVHIAATYDGTTRRIFIDVVEVASDSYSGNFINTDVPVRIGSSGFLGGAEYFGGLIDDVRIWEVARTQTEILANYNRELVGNETGLVGYWKFNEGSGTTATDSTANGNDGTISGATYTTDVPTLSPATYTINVKEDWTITNKINFDDFNRIEQNVFITRQYLIDIQYAIPSITSKTDRDKSWIDFLSSINRLEGNLETLRTNFVTPSGYPGAETWLVGEGFDYTEANRIETDIRMLFELAGLVFESFIYCGTFSCGEEGLI